MSQPVHKSASVQTQAMPGGVQPAPAIPSYLMSPPALSPSLPGTANTNANPFILKFKTKQMKVCQACCKNYEGTNDTMGLVVARMERWMVSNLTTGAQFLGKESNSHYHAHMSCLSWQVLRSKEVIWWFRKMLWGGSKYYSGEQIFHTFSEK